ncbi:MAG: hypothetical protein U0Z17_07260 [Bacteroidales bacterium]
MLKRFADAGEPLKRITNYKVWQDGNRAKLVYSNKFLMEKLNYIHNNPIEYGLCSQPWEYKYSSAVNYAEKDSVLDVVLLNYLVNLTDEKRQKLYRRRGTRASEGKLKSGK